MNTLSALRSTVIAGLASLLLVTPSAALEGSVSALLWWSTTGNANPALSYQFEASFRADFTKFSALEAVLPVGLVGQLKQGSTLRDHCLDGGFVNSLRLTCMADSNTACPWAQGTWRAENRTTIGTPPAGQILAEVSDSVVANCPPVGGGGGGGCLIGIPSDVDQVISLDTGLPLDRSAYSDLPTVRLKRRAEDSHGEFMLTEWAIVEAADSGLLKVHRASSTEYGDHLFGEPQPMLDALHRSSGDSRASKLGAAPAGRYLVVQGSGHRYKLPLPMVKLRPDQPELAIGSADSLVSLRVSFDHHGHLLGVEAIDGSEKLARQLAESIQLEFVEGAAHRTSVFAVFDVGSGTPEMLTAAPFFPRCCCGDFFCV